MKEKILKLIKGKIGKTSFSDRTLTVRAERLARKYPTDDLITDDIINEVIEELKVDEGQYSHDLAEGYKAMEERYKSKVPPVATIEEKSNEESSEMPLWFKTYSEQQSKELEALKTAWEADKKLAQASSFKVELTNAMKSKGANKDYIIRNVLRDYSYADGDTVESVLDKCLAKYDNECTEAFGNGAAPRTAALGNGMTDETKKANLEAYKKELIATGKLSE